MYLHSNFYPYKKSYEKGIMQLVSADAIVFSKKFEKRIGPDPIISQPSPAQTTAHSPELILHILKSRD